MLLESPDELNPALQPERLAAIAELMIETRDGTVALHDPAAGDGPWSLGCRCYDRTRNQLIAFAERHHWMTIEDDSLCFVFRIDDVPIRFHKEGEDAPRQKLKHQPESAAVQLTLDVAPASTSYLRLVVLTGEDETAERIELVKYSATEIPEQRWVIVDCTANVSSGSAVVPFQQHGVKLDPPVVRPRRDDTAGEDA